MRQLVFPTAAILALSALPAAAVPMQAVITGTIVSTYQGSPSDSSGLFGSVEAGDVATVTYLYDPDLAESGFSYNDGTYAAAYGGGYYGLDTAASPITSATFSVGSGSYTFDPSYYGEIRLTAWEDNGVYASAVSFLAWSENTDLRTYATFYDSVSHLTPLSLNASYSVIFPDMADDASIFQGSLLDVDGTVLGYTNFAFAMTSFVISPYTAPTDPVDPTMPPVPLPAGAPLVLTALAALAALRRRRG